MALYICEKIGLHKAPFEYLKKHDEGSHLLSVLLLKHLQGQPKSGSTRFPDYFISFLDTLPYGRLQEELEAF